VADRLSQQPSEVVLDGAPNARVSQTPAEVVISGATVTNARVSQAPSEVVIDALNNARMSSCVVEVIIDHLGDVLTQAPAEVVLDGLPHGVLAQMAAEILIDSSAAATCCLSFLDMANLLAARLYDPTFQFWTQAELTLYLQEAMQTWQALTGYWRGDFPFVPTAGVAWYDIPSMASSLRKYTVSDDQLLTTVQYHLLEPPTGSGVWTGSAQFALTDLTSALLRRKEELVGISGCTWTRIQIPAIPGRTALPTNVVDLRRATFTPASPALGGPITLWQSDQWSYQSFQVGYTTSPGPFPSSFSVSTEPWLTFDVDVQPGVPGTYTLLVIQSGPQCSDPNLPDDWQWVTKWGMLSDLLSRESNAKDPLRAKYAEQRYQQGLKLLSVAPALLVVAVNGVPIWQDSVRSMDTYSVGWEAAPLGPPTMAVTAGLNLLALSPPPDSSTAYNLTLTVIENAPVALVAGGCLSLSRELVDLMLDYAQHLAAFKMGGEEFVATEQLYNRFMQYAAMYSSRLGEQGEFQRILWDISQRQEDLDPRYGQDAEPGRQD